MAIVNITLENTSTTVQTNVPAAFGQVFAKGHLPVGSFVSLSAPDGSKVACQMDVKATHKDGSIKHALLAAIIPSMAPSASVTYGIEIAQSGPSGTTVVPADFPGLNAIATIIDTGTNITGPNAGTTYTANASDRLAFANYKTWRSGPICSEWIVRVPFLTAEGVRHPDLHARFEIQAFKGQARARVHCIVENTWLKPKAVPSGSSPWEPVSLLPIVYTPKLTIGNTVVYSRAINGYHRARLSAKNTFNGTATGLLNDGTVYTATITVDGAAKPISLVGSANQYYGNLYANITAQLGGMGTCVIDEGNLGLRIKSATTGVGSSAVISDYGTLFPALGQFNPYRPIRGDEHTHHPGQRWKKTYWWGAEPAVHIRHDMAYLIASYALPNYDLSIVANQGQIDANWENILKNSDLGRNGLQKPDMPGQGGAPGIGILSAWQAMFVVEPNKKAKDTMLLQADLMGSWSVCRREFDTDEQVSFKKWPYVGYVSTIADSKNYATGLNEGILYAPYPAGIPGSGMSADLAHHPDFNFAPYMVTGDYFYLEGMLFYHTFISTCLNPHDSKRGGAKCLWRAEPQVRGKAWTMRTAVHTAYLIPDDHSLKPEVEYIIAQNTPDLIATYATPGGANYNMFGLMQNMDYRGGIATSNFMEEFACQATGRAIELGYTGFLPLLKYKALHVTGRLTSGADFCWQYTDSYDLCYKKTSSSPYYTSWKEVFQNTAPAAALVAACGSPEMAAALGTIQNGFTRYPDWAEGGAANAQPAVAYCATYNLPKADDAWLVFSNATTKILYEYEPQFAIIPRDIPDEPLIGLFRSGANGLGGAISTTPSDALLFDRVEGPESASGDTEYICEYVRNTHSTNTIYDAALWLSKNTPSTDTVIEVGRGTSAINSIEQTVTNESAAPVGVTFTTAATKVDGITLGTLPPGAFVAVWYKRTISAGAKEILSDTYTRTIEGMVQ